MHTATMGAIRMLATTCGANAVDGVVGRPSFMSGGRREFGADVEYLLIAMLRSPWDRIINSDSRGFMCENDARVRIGTRLSKHRKSPS